MIDFTAKPPRKRPKKATRTKGTKRPKKLSISKLGTMLEALQKEITILRYGNDCYTCKNTNLQGKNCHLGHVPWPRTEISTSAKFNPLFTRIQCMVCNVHKGGQGAKALQRMMEEGVDIKALWEEGQKMRGKLHNRAWFEEKIKEYTEEINNHHPQVTLSQQGAVTDR